MALSIIITLYVCVWFLAAVESIFIAQKVFSVRAEQIDSWKVYPKTRAAHAAGETSVPHLRGDALLVEKSEAASTLIYWNGKRYVWSQQGD